MSSNKYYQVSGTQLFIVSVLIGIIAAALITINIMIKEFLMLPVVITDSDNRCINVVNYQNGDAYTCSDVSIILRNFRTQKN